MSAKNTLKRLWSHIAPYAIGGAVGVAIGNALLGSPVLEPVYEAQGAVNGFRARFAGGIVFETENGTKDEKECLAQTKQFVQTLPENFIAPIKDYGVFIRVAESNEPTAPTFSARQRRVTLYYDTQTKSCDTVFSAAHELGHAFDAAKGQLSESAAYRKVVNEVVASPEIQELLSSPAARADLSAMPNGNFDELTRSETFADIMACQLLPNAYDPNFLNFCHRQVAAPARAYVASTLVP